jgi:hypothetical protein
MFLVRCPSPDGYKTRAARLIGDGLKCRWTNRENGYIASKAKIEKFKALYEAGWDASAITPGQFLFPIPILTPKRVSVL